MFVIFKQHARALKYLQKMQDLKEIKKKELSKADSLELLEKNLDYILNKISENVSYSTLAKEFNVNVANLCLFLNQDSIKEKKEVALQIASYLQIEEAKQHLESIEADDTSASVRKKCELAQFATFLAKAKNRKEFDLNYREDKQETNNNIVVIPANQALELLSNNKNKQESN